MGWDDWNIVSVSTPFLRRFFGDEAGREFAETLSLIASLRTRTVPCSVRSIAEDILPHLYEVSAELTTPLVEALVAMIWTEGYIFEFPEPQLSGLTLQEFAEYRNFLRHKQYFLDNADDIVRLIHEALVRIFAATTEALPKTESPSPFTIPLIYALPNPGVLITKLLVTLSEDPYRTRLIFRDIQTELYRNLCDASGLVPFTEHKRPFKHAAESDLPLDELNDQYLAGTPFHELYRAPVPLKFAHEDRFNHMHVVGGTGAGKTTLLQNLILHDLQSENPPALVVIDSQGDLIPKVSRLALFEEKLADRLVLITPKDIDHPPALNIFDLNRTRLGDYDQLTKEQVVAGAIQTFDYLFSGLLGADLTAKQGVFFKYVARLMLSLPEAMGRNATILDMLQLMENSAPYQNAIASLPPIQRAFFERDFHTKTFAQTKEQIRYRLQAIIENPTLARLFTSPSTKVDLFTELNRGSIVLVDTAKDFLKGASSHFGRIFISLVLQAVLERAAIPERDRKPAFLIVDEAAAYFDSNIDDLLTETRKYKLGCVFAHQYLDQCTQSLRASLAANTSIKFAGGLSMADARHMAPDMRTTPEFILGQPKLHFACHIRNVTPQAVSIPVSVGSLESQPRLSPDAYEQLLWRNRQRVSLGSDAKGALADADEASTVSHLGGTHRENLSPASPPDPAAAAEEW